jgi:predicted flap endonuclease-1-like 5' DNA nuclease
MSGIVIFFASFLCLFGITVMVPTVPPGEIIYAFLGISEISLPLSGISGVVFVYGIINGTFWGIIILITYGLGTRLSKKKTHLPEGFTSYPSLLKSPSEYVPPKSFVKRSLYNDGKRKTHAPLDRNIETIEGIGHVYGTKLRKFHIKTLADLLKAGSTRNKRYYLAKKVGVSHSTILRWVCRADFFRIAGIGKQYSSLLESAGVNSVTDLSNRNPNRLYEKLMETNREKNLVKRTPPYNKVEDWIERAGSLRRIVIY